MKQAVTVQASKYDSKLHYEWKAVLVEQTEHYALVYCEADRTLIHHTKQKQFIIPYPSLEWFYFDRGYTIAVSFKPEGLMYYCNIALPAKLDGNIISFIDLDLDYLKEANEDWKVEDEDEFELHQHKYSYPSHIIQYAYDELDKLKEAIASKQPPFNVTEAQFKLLLEAYLANQIAK